MQALRKLFILILLTSILPACAAPPNSITQTPRPNSTENASETITPTPAASQLNVEAEALRGKPLEVWHPWFGAEASLFESQVA
ncbi:MAG TPA: hypothetical protein VKE92_03395, partial [Anaerolineales bacterium]|nr:hypothetical protein [Anaerolineales bacterium]